MVDGKIQATMALLSGLHNLFTTICLYCLNDKLKRRLPNHFSALLFLYFSCNYRFLGYSWQIMKIWMLCLVQIVFKKISFLRKLYISTGKLFNKRKRPPSKIGKNKPVFSREDRRFFIFCSKNFLKNLFNFFKKEKIAFANKKIKGWTIREKKKY